MELWCLASNYSALKDGILFILDNPDEWFAGIADKCFNTLSLGRYAALRHNYQQSSLPSAFVSPPHHLLAAFPYSTGPGVISHSSHSSYTSSDCLLPSFQGKYSNKDESVWPACKHRQRINWHERKPSS
jgi:hypothetical protein